jgi:hypothetical protein
VEEGYSKYLVINVQHIKGYGNKFEFRGMPWGTSDAGRVLQREMDNMGRADYEVNGKKFERLMKGDCEESFQDDTILWNDDEEQHIADVEEWLNRMFAAGFPPNWDESIFFEDKELPWCGMLLTEEGIKQIPERVEALDRLRAPKDFEEAEKWLGMIGWHREFIPKLAGMLKPIYEVQSAERKRKQWRSRNRGTGKRMPEKLKGHWNWNEECEEAKRAIMEEIKKDVMLYRTDESGLLKMYVDYGMKNGAVSAFLAQERDGREVPISYASRKLRENEIDSGTPFCEFLALEFGIEKFDNIISGRETEVFTDHESLAKLNLKNPKGKWARILRKIIESGVTVKSLSGDENVVADALVRLSEGVELNVIQQVENVEDRKMIVKDNHIHLSDRKTVQSIRKKYNWKGIFRDVENERRTCEYCQRNLGRGEMRVPMESIEATRPFEVMSVDLCPMITMKNGEKKSFGVACDVYTKEIEAFTCKGLGAQEFVERVEELLVEPLGVAKLIGDNTEIIRSEAMKELRKKHELEVRLTVSNRHQANPVERRIQTFKQILKSKLQAGKGLRESLKETKNEMNNKLVCDSTNLTPYEMRTGFPFQSGVDRKVQVFVEMRKKQFKEAKQLNEEMRERQKEYYDRGKKERKFRAGDWVLVTNFYKSKWIEPKRLGPFKIEKVMENNNYLVYDHYRNNWKKYNIENLTKYYFEENLRASQQKEEERETKSPERELQQGSRVRVWFEDKKKNFKGTIRKKLENERDEYEIDWDDKTQEREIVELRKDNMTKEKSNEDRWSFILNSAK